MSYKWWLGIAAGLFGIGLGIGAVFALRAPATMTDFLSEELALLSKLSASLGPFKVSTAIFIFIKNASAILLSFILSPILCLLPILTLTLNGLLLSFVAAVIIQQKSFVLVLVGVLPHGIFEIPALIIGEAAALSFGIMAMTALLSPKERKLLLPNLKRNLRYLVVALILLVPAAIIETFVTPLFLQ